MKLMICANLDVGGLPAIDLPSKSVAQWQQDKIEALASALADASERGADACVIAGGLYAKGFVAQSLFAEAIEEAGCHGMPVVYVPLPGEAEGLEERVAPVEGVAVIRLQDTTTLDIEADGSSCNIVVKDCIDPETLDEEVRRAREMAILRCGHDIAFCADGEIVSRIGALEPSAFREELPSGYLLVKIKNGAYKKREWVRAAIHPFIVHALTLDGLESSRDLVTTVGEAVKDADRAACLRVELRGRIPLDVYINTDELASRLSRYFFYVEVADECAVDIDVDGLGADVSLLAEFVRQVSGDDSLSETEKTRILRCGWNVLNGKELAE